MPAGRSALAIVPLRTPEGTKAAHPSGTLGSVLVPLDLGPASDRVLGRVARLPLAGGARVTLVHVLPDAFPTGLRRRAEREATRALIDRARHLAGSLPGGVTIEPVLREGGVSAEIASCAESARPDLVVMGRGGGRALREAFLGSTAERVVRRGQLPVLVVRLPARSAYARPALAVDLDEAAKDVIALFLRVVAPPRPELSVLHAYDIPYRGLIYPSLTDAEAAELREREQRKASRAIAHLLSSALARARVPTAEARWRTVLRCGSARSTIEKLVAKLSVDLLVLGTHAYSGVVHSLLGTVAGDVLRQVSCDVLVVPPRPTSAAP